MVSFTDTILSVMQRVEVYNEIFNAISKEIQENSCSAAANKKGNDMYLLCRRNVNRFFIEEDSFRKTLDNYGEQVATGLLLQGLDVYKEGVYYWLNALNDQCEVVDEYLYKKSLTVTQSSFELINQACKKACGDIENAHSVHKM